MKNRGGKQPRSRKITGLRFHPEAARQLLISSNDSRVRLYEGYTLRTKCKGPATRHALRDEPSPSLTGVFILYTHGLFIKPEG